MQILELLLLFVNLEMSIMFAQIVFPVKDLFMLIQIVVDCYSDECKQVVGGVGNVLVQVFIQDGLYHRMG